MRSALDVATEMTELAATHAPDHLWFADDIFGLRVSWLTEFVDHLESSGTRIPFTIQSRCDLMSPETVALLARAGCEEVWLGAESGSQAVLDAMDKQITVDDIRSARQALGDAGIRAGFFVQFGYPGERWSDIQATVALVRETLPDDIGISVSYPLPGTRFHAMVADQLGDKTNWEVSGDLEMMFAGTYTSDFYRHLHRALHDDLDLCRREAGLTRAPAPFFESVDLDGHRRRVAEQWAELERLEATAAHPAPTVLAPTRPRPMPDLSQSFG
jgi:anaerobic magnesium-protoporphyrin IX monomethyl ester cyclase